MLELIFIFNIFSFDFSQAVSALSNRFQSIIVVKSQAKISTVIGTFISKESFILELFTLLN